MAEGVGFEPTAGGGKPTAVFKTAPFSHSGTLRGKQNFSLSAVPGAALEPLFHEVRALQCIEALVGQLLSSDNAAILS